jgi:predicted CoA-substrate-specific enzyme activase
MAYSLGIDIGSVTSKGVILNDGDLVAHTVIQSGINYTAAAIRLRDELVEKSGISFDDIRSIASTGQGADRVEYSQKKIDNIRCCARGIRSIFESVKTVVDVQGQLSQVIRINEQGRVSGFVVSEKCAAGSGRFLQIIANILRVDLDDIGELSLRAQNPVTFTTGCAVFSESEAISRVSEGFSKEDILAGVHRSIANKISVLVDRIGMEQEVAITGGGGLDIGLIAAIEEKLGITLRVPERPQIITALGAAIMAAEV